MPDPANLSLRSQFYSDADGHPVPVLGFTHGQGVDTTNFHKLGAIATVTSVTFPVAGNFSPGVYEFGVYLTSDLVDGVPSNVYVKPGAVGVVVIHAAGVPTDGTWLQNTSKLQTFTIKLGPGQPKVAILNPSPVSITVFARRLT